MTMLVKKLLKASTMLCASEDEVQLPTFAQFMATKRSQANAYVSEPDFEQLYVRKGKKYINGQYVDAITLARFEVEHEKQNAGVFTRFVKHIQKQWPTYGIYVECVHNPYLGSKLLRMGFVQVNEDPSYWLTGEES